jgi:hypothetical protein
LEAYTQSKRAVTGKWARAERIEEGVKEGLAVGQNTNQVVHEMQKDISDIRGLLMDGVVGQGGDAAAVAMRGAMMQVSGKALEKSAKATLAQEKKAATAVAKAAAAEEKMATKAAAAEEKKAAKAAAAKAKSEAGKVRIIVQDR